MRVGHSEQIRTANKPRVLIVEQETAQAKEAFRVLAEAGYQCESFPDIDSALARLGQSDAELLVMNLAPAESAREILRRVALEAPETAIILTVSNPAVPAAVAALRQGAFDYVTKPINPDELTAVADRAMEMVSLRRENRVLHEQLDVASMSAAFVAESPASRALAAIIRRAAPANSPVLIEGESGTGKELVARMLHHWSLRAGAPFVKLNFKLVSSVAWLPGGPHAAHRPGAGADAVLEEHVERARGGTLFLDEVGEAGPEFQSLMLRLVGEGEPDRRTAAAGRQRGTRIVVSSNRPLADEVTAGRFRADLYFALNVIPIRVPPLRDRRADILPLARHFLARHGAESGRAMTLGADAEQALVGYSWPGNVRELENVIERAVVMSPGERIPAESLLLPQPAPAAPAAKPEPRLAAAPEPRREPESDAAEKSRVAESAPAAGEAQPPGEATLQETLDRAAAERIRKALDTAKGDRNTAAAALGIDRTTLQRLMKRLGL